MSIDITPQDLEQAIIDKAFMLYYQPKVNFLTGRISGAEALIRWHDSEKGFISPDIFIPLAEKNGYITRITEQIISLAIESAQTLKKQGLDIAIAVNTSPVDFMSNKVLNILQTALDDKKITPQDLKIELTETATLEDNDQIISNLNLLTTMGFELVMDDFGTGYSSIDLLSRLPFSTLKVDQGVIRRMVCSTKSLNIVNTVINMARTLRMYVVAEGIEDHNSYRFLAYAGCLEAQGYWISKPLPFDEFQDFVQTNPQYPSTHLGMIYHAHMNNIYFRKSVLDAVMYKNCGVAEEMQSVTRPDIEFEPKKTRVGKWYFGIGQELSDRPSFRAIEAPHKKMHEIGKALFAEKQQNTGALILEFNTAFEQLDKAIHTLEAELMAEEPCRIWQRSKEVAS